MIENIRTIKVGDYTIELAVDESLNASVLRAFAGATPLDAAVDALEPPSRPLWLCACVTSIRWYRRRIATRLGQRCVFEPSCSRYAELALRRRGFLHGCGDTLLRLSRCRPGRGGIDLPRDVHVEEVP